ncbi:MAG: vWA domain-containing protein, partial [Planctomycetota bacterium]
FLSNPVTMVATAPMDRLDLRMGSVGSGAAGASGAVDQLTFEVLRLLEERPTTVIWLFDQSRSLQAQRATIRERFDRMYLELGMAEDKNLTSIKRERDAGNIPLLTSIYAFGEKVQQVTPEPLESLAEIQQAMESIKDDDSGVERIFEAVTTAAREAKSFTRMVSVQTPDGRIRREPRRNVMLIVVTDERGDDISQLDSAIAECKKFGIPVSIIGVPAPFGKAVSEIKYVDPDPQFDQTPQVGLVNQGPESYLPEVVDIGFISRDKDLTLDSGFGPYGLTRLCYETGGIYLSVHPNRKIGRRVRFGEIDPFAAHFDYFFDPVVMRRYRPDYLPPRDYLLAVKQSPLRDSLVRAASMKGASGLDRPRLRFVVTEAAQLKREIDQAQTTAATLMPALDAMARMLEPGMSARDKEGSPRWRAGYDLAAGRVLAQLVRTDAYNYILADLESGRKRFEKEKNNTWILEPSDDLSFSSKLNNRAKAARELLEDVVNDHPDTPWALLAKTELDVPMGWQWKEDFTDLSPPQRTRPGNNNNNPNRMPRDDQKRMIDRKEKRPLPKL